MFRARNCLRGWSERHGVRTGMVIQAESGPLVDALRPQPSDENLRSNLTPRSATLPATRQNPRRLLQRGGCHGCGTGRQHPNSHSLVIRCVISSFCAAVWGAKSSCVEPFCRRHAQGRLARRFVGENKTRPGGKSQIQSRSFSVGKVVATRSKTLLPTHDVCLTRTLASNQARRERAIQFNGTPIGLTICEDIWNDEDFLARPSLSSHNSLDGTAGGGCANCSTPRFAGGWAGCDPPGDAAKPGGVAQARRRSAIKSAGTMNSFLTAAWCSDGAGQFAQGKHFEEDLLMVKLGRQGQGLACPAQQRRTSTKPVPVCDYPTSAGLQIGGARL